MQILEKFYSDLLKASKKENYIENMPKLFLKQVAIYDKALNDLAADLTEYWRLEHSNIQPKQEMVDWFYNLFSFLSDEFEPDMDFSDRDWEEIKFSVSEVQDTLDLELLNSFMTILLERKKL